MRQRDGFVELETLYDGLNRVLEEDGGTIKADYTTTPEPWGAEVVTDGLRHGI